MPTFSPIPLLETRPGARHARWGAGICLALAALTTAGGAAARANPPASQNPAPVLAPAEVSPYWFGVAVESLPPAIAEQLKLRPDQGAMVMAVFAGSPAEKAGIKANDLLIELNGKPLTSQDDLARAANTAIATKGGISKAGPMMQSSDVVYLRKGDRYTARINPERRPTEAVVREENRPTPAVNAVAGAEAESRHIVLSNGATVQFGPGYQIDARSQENLEILRQAVDNGQTLILTRDTDAAGNVVKNTLNDGVHTYDVDPKNIKALPANYQQLAGKWVEGTASETSRGLGTANLAAESGREASNNETDLRLKRLEQQNDELKAQLAELKALIERANAMPAVPPAAPPAKQ